MKQPISSYQGNKFLVYFRSSVFFIGLILSTLIIAPITIAVVPVLSFPVRYRFFSGVWVSVNLWMVERVCGLSFHVEGMENIPNENAIVFSKHQSAWETIAIQKIFPPLVFVLKRELLWLPIYGWALATFDPIAIDRKSQNKALRQIIDQGIQRLKSGRWVVIYPEGTRVAPGQVKKFNAGGALLANKSGYPVVPMAHNAGEFWPRKSFLKFPGVIQVRIGPVIETKGKSASQINREAQIWIENETQTISSANNES